MSATLSDTIRGLITAVDELELGAPAVEELQTIIQRGEFRPSEDESIGYWFARFLSVRESLWTVIEDVLEAINTPDRKIRGHRDLKYFLVGYAAVCLLVRIDRVMLFGVAQHSVVQRKLNEAFPEYRIPRKQYTTIFSSFIDQRNVLAIREAMQFAARNRKQLDALTDDADVGFLADLLPALESALNPSKLSHLRRAWAYVSHKWRRRGVVSITNMLAGILEGFGRTASEFYDANNKNVSSAELEQVSELLRPGDIIVTRHAKALTNLFLPGFWPHTALYIGSAEQRDALGVHADWSKEQRWTGDICVLEARKDGVKFRPLSDTLCVDVFAILRPELSDDGIRRGLERAVLHEGKMYNFDFDFFNSDRIVCTEVVYRAYDGLEDMQFPLQERAGRKTLSAEDLLDYALNSRQMKPIAIFGVEGCDGRIVTGDEVERLLINSYRAT